MALFPLPFCFTMVEEFSAITLSDALKQHAFQAGPFLPPQEQTHLHKFTQTLLIFGKPNRKVTVLGCYGVAQRLLRNEH